MKLLRAQKTVRRTKNRFADELTVLNRVLRLTANLLKTVKRFAVEQLDPWLDRKNRDNSNKQYCE